MFTCNTHRVSYLLVVLLCVIAGAALAAGPDFINYRATLTDGAGDPVPDDIYLVHFGVYADETGGTAMWTEDHSVETINGGFKVKLGSVDPMPEDLFADTLRWIGIAVDPDDEMVPRTLIGTVPWALNTAFAEKVANKSVGKDQIMDKGVGKEQLDDRSVGKAKLDTLSVATGKISLKAVGKAQLADKAVGKGQLEDKAVGKDQLEDQAVGKGQLEDNAVGRGQLEPAAVGKEEIDNSAVSASKIENGAVSLDKLAPVTAQPGWVIKWKGTEWAVEPDETGDGEAYWDLQPDNVLRTDGDWGLSRLGSVLYGTLTRTHVNLGGVGSQTGRSGFDDEHCVIGGGTNNSAYGDAATVAGGSSNQAIYDESHGSSFAFVGGGRLNVASNQWAAIVGGDRNQAAGSFSSVAGGQTNEANSMGSSIGGGQSNLASASYAVVSGGHENTATGQQSAIAGGGYNSVSGTASTVGGGSANQAAAGYAVVSGGQNNIAVGEGSSIVGGSANTASGTSSAVGGGTANRAFGAYSTVPGGMNNTAEAEGSFAAGACAKATHAGAVVIAANAATDTLELTESGAPGQIVLRAEGGIYITELNEVAPSDEMDKLIYTSTGAYLSRSGEWKSVSDKNAKENFEPIDANDVLAQVVALDVARWNYKVESPDVTHIGPTAQDFHAQFGVGDDDKTISSIDASGIALAAIKALHEKTTELEKTSRETEELKNRVDELTRLVEQLIRERSSGERGR